MNISLSTRKRLRKNLLLFFTGYSRNSSSILKTQVSRSGEDMKGKFGRILGDFIIDKDGEPCSVVDALMEAGHCVPYMGGAKEDLVAAHMVNRKRLIEEGVVAVTLEQAGLV